MDGAGVQGTGLVAVLGEKKKTPALALGRCVDGAGVGGTRPAAALEEKKKTLALALGAVHEWCRSGERWPGGSAGGREGEGTSTSLEGGAWRVQE